MNILLHAHAGEIQYSHKTRDWGILVTFEILTTINSPWYTPEKYFWPSLVFLRICVQPYELNVQTAVHACTVQWKVHMHSPNLYPVWVY